MTRVSTRSWTGVRERRYPGTAVGAMPSDEAKAAFLEGSAESTLICFSTSQAGTDGVPPYSSGEAPLTLRVTVVGAADGGFDAGFDSGVVPGFVSGFFSGVDGLDGVEGGGGCGGGGLSGGGVACLAAVDSVKGSGPEAAAGCRKTSLPAEVVVPPLPLGLVRTTARVTAAARATIVVASRGTERHQGLCGGSGGPGGTPLPDPPGGAGGGGGGGPSRPPERGPEGGPVGRPDEDDGGCEGGCDGCVGHGGCWPEG